MRPVTHYAGGKAWNGHWRRDGDDLCVMSAYGGARVAIGRRKNLDALALETFRGILRDYAAGKRPAQNDKRAPEPKP